MEIKLLEKNVTNDSVYQDYYDFLKLNNFEDVYFIAYNKKYPNFFIQKMRNNEILVSWRWEDTTITHIFGTHITNFDKFILFLQHFDYDKQVEMTKLEAKK